MLKTRVITAIVLLLLVLGVIFYLPPLGFAVGLAIFILIGAWEWSGLLGDTHKLMRAIYVFLVVVCMALINFFPIGIPLLIGGLIWLWILLSLIAYQVNDNALGFRYPLVRALGGIFVLVSAWVALLVLRSEALFGPAWLVYVLCIIWSADVGAYFSGRLWGNKSFFPKVSPNKTLAGFWGGMLLALIVIVIGGLLMHLNWQSLLWVMGLGIMTAVFSVIGDLGISLMKRISNKKDSGSIIPGHGGVLDRLDSITAATVIFVLLASLIRF